MPVYRYSAYTQSGKLEAGELEASSVQNVLQLLHNRGLVPINAQLATKASQPPLSFGGLLSNNGLGLSGWSEFSGEFAVFLDAGLPVDECLRLMASDGRTVQSRKLSAQLLDATLSGQALSEAIEQNAADAPPIVVTLIKAGERSGKIAEAMSDLSTFLATQIGVQREIRSALLYPAVLAVTALITFIVIATTLVPALMPMFEQASAKPPPVLAFIRDVSIFMSDNGLILTGAGLLSAITLFLWLRTASGRLTRDQFILRLPFFGKLIQKTNISLFARTLGTLLANGLPLSEALNTANNVVTNRSMQTKIRPAAVEIMEGSKLADALRRTSAFTPFALRFVSVGEETSKLDSALLNLANILQRDVAHRTKNGIALLGPAMTIIIGLAVGGLILTVMQAVLSVNDLVLR